MFTCKRCESEARDGATCATCKAKFDFPCAGISEAGWRKLGERKLTWKCQNCKSAPVASPQISSLKTSPVNSESIMTELQGLSAKMEALPALMESVRAIQAELAELKTIRQEVSQMKSSFESYGQDIKALAVRVSDLEAEMEIMGKTKEAVVSLQDRIIQLESRQSESEQRSRMNNIEIKGVPISKDEDLFVLMDKIVKWLSLVAWIHLYAKTLITRRSVFLLTSFNFISCILGLESSFYMLRQIMMP
ncbi:hypothetical protein PYW07_006135 [Mythimna separata]|uniref:Zinc finger PHD-type domain-containing protein n=1 Tax=Mythimna separata TaxID=271217 RepID=A0AAD7YKW5_MYTSE|nr:hypothetical protein PYW07_006135 [Mythimna separata]